MSYRIGSGVDFHKLAEGRELWIGGVKIPHYKGAVGHSDADVLLHAICDAFLVQPVWAISVIIFPTLMPLTRISTVRSCCKKQLT